MRNILMTIPIVKTAIESEEASVIDALRLAFVADSCYTLGMARSSGISFKFL